MTSPIIKKEQRRELRYTKRQVRKAKRKARRLAIKSERKALKESGFYKVLLITSACVLCLSLIIIIPALTIKTKESDRLQLVEQQTIKGGITTYIYQDVYSGKYYMYFVDSGYFNSSEVIKIIELTDYVPAVTKGGEQ